MNKTTIKVNEFYTELHSIQNLFEVLIHSMSYCQENEINTTGNIELAMLIQKRIFNLVGDIDNFLTENE